MRRWIYHNIEAVLLGISVVLIAIIVVYYIFVIRAVAADLETALNPDANREGQSSFNLKAAAQLNLHGLTPNTGGAVSPPSTTPPPLSSPSLTPVPATPTPAKTPTPAPPTPIPSATPTPEATTTPLPTS
jgi:hypothetical protein